MIKTLRNKKLLKVALFLFCHLICALVNKCTKKNQLISFIFISFRVFRAYFNFSSNTKYVSFLIFATYLCCGKNKFYIHIYCSNALPQIFFIFPSNIPLK